MDVTLYQAMDQEVPPPPDHWAGWMRFFRYATALTLLVLFALAFRKFYPPARNAHLLRVAKVFAKNAQLRPATLSLQQILVSDPRNLDAVLMMAELAEASNSPQTLVWRKRVVQIAPESFRYRVDWIKAALKMGEVALAAEGLATVDEAGRRTAVFHHLAASIAIAWNHVSEAEQHAAYALKLEPDNDGYKFNLALIWMQAEDEARHSKGREMMLALSDHSEFRYRALRAIISESVEQRNWKEATKHSWALQSEPQSTLDDRLNHLDLLDRVKDSKLGEFLASVQIMVVKSPDAVLTTGMWMVQHARAREALEWVATLPPEERLTPPLRVLEAESYAALNDWKGLANYLDLTDWKTFEYLRQAYLARMARAENREEAFEEHWDAATHGATGNTRALTLLNRLAREWNWSKQSDDLLWDVAAGTFNNRWALEALYQRYEKAGDTRSLYQVVLRMLEIKPNDMVSRNNFALLSMLLGVRVEQAHAICRELFTADPENPIILSTYAYSLLLQGKSQAAVNVFKALPEERLTEPSVAAYYGIVLAANGEKEGARKYAQLARKASLLPEERALLNKII